MNPDLEPSPTTPRYLPTRESLRSHPVPKWFEDAKLGIFIHWGLFSVPAFAPRLGHVSEAFTEHYPLGAVMTPYTEWYDNAVRVAESPSARHHAEHWGGRPYAEFRAPFSRGLEQWDPKGWAALFRRAGARYVVLVTKHHDGYCLWPSRVPNPHRASWTCPRDIVGELASAVRAEGLRFGIYYSGGIDWSFNPKPVRTMVEFMGSAPGGDYPTYAEAQVRELIERYSAEHPLERHLLADGPAPSAATHRRLLRGGAGRGGERPLDAPRPALRLLGLRPVQRLLDAWLARRIRREAAKEEYSPGIVPPRPAHYDFRTPEYTSFDEVSEHKWETTRGLTPSFGYNRADREEDHESPTELVRSFIDTVSKNGNLLLNVGPRGEDAGIPDPQRTRLEALGGWLRDNGEAIYETRPWVDAESTTGDGIPVRFTPQGRSAVRDRAGNADGHGAHAARPRFPLGRSSGHTASPMARRFRHAGTASGLQLSLGVPLTEAPAHAFAVQEP